MAPAEHKSSRADDRPFRSSYPLESAGSATTSPYRLSCLGGNMSQLDLGELSQLPDFDDAGADGDAGNTMPTPRLEETSSAMPSAPPPWLVSVNKCLQCGSNQQILTQADKKLNYSTRAWPSSSPNLFGWCEKIALLFEVPAHRLEIEVVGEVAGVPWEFLLSAFLTMLVDDMPIITASRVVEKATILQSVLQLWVEARRPPSSCSEHDSTIAPQSQQQSQQQNQAMVCSAFAPPKKKTQPATPSQAATPVSSSKPQPGDPDDEEDTRRPGVAAPLAQSSADASWTPMRSHCRRIDGEGPDLQEDICELSITGRLPVSPVGSSIGRMRGTTNKYAFRMSCIHSWNSFNMGTVKALERRVRLQKSQAMSSMHIDMISAYTDIQIRLLCILGIFNAIKAWKTNRTDNVLVPIIGFLRPIFRLFERTRHTLAADLQVMLQRANFHAAFQEEKKLSIAFNELNFETLPLLFEEINNHAPRPRRKSKARTATTTSRSHRPRLNMARRRRRPRNRGVASRSPTRRSPSLP